MSEKPEKILVTEDDPGLQKQMKWSLADYEVYTASSREEAMGVMRKEEPKVAIVDLGLPPDPDGATEGLQLIQDILQFRPDTKVIVASGNQDRDNAVAAVGLGAYDFCPKPVDLDVVNMIVQRAFQLYELEAKNRELLSRSSGALQSGMISAAPQMEKVARTLEKIAPADVSVLITGESGTGKEVAARILHELSNRKKANFVAINCAAIPDNLLESELFGFEKGAFTGAHRQTIGKVEQADGGTLFLDEIADMPMALQAKMLRFLQERVFERVGGRKSISVDVRVISATNKDLKQAIAEESFRDDLYYRLNEVSLHLPPLRERDGDAVLLARHFLQALAEAEGSEPKRLSDEAAAVIARYGWPGNIRELANKIKRANVMADGKFVTVEDIGLDEEVEVEAFPTLKEVRAIAELKLIRRALAQCDNNLAQAARLLGISRPTLYELLKTHDIQKPSETTETTA